MNRILATTFNLLLVVHIFLASTAVLAIDPHTTSKILAGTEMNDELCAAIGAGGGGSIAANGTVSPLVGKGMSPDAQKKFQEIVVAAGSKFNVDPNLIAAFYFEENNTNQVSELHNGTAIWRDPPPPYGHGPAWAQSTSGDGHSWPDGTIGARGPFQFEPGTWDGYKQDGNGDGTQDPKDLADEGFAAAAYIAASGGKKGASDADILKAAKAYNNDSTYDNNVLTNFKFLSGGSQANVNSAGSGGGVYVLGDSLMVGSYYTGNKYLKSDLDTNGVTAVVDASVGRSISSGGSDPGNTRPGAEKSGLDALNVDQDAIKAAPLIVIELGTNTSGPVDNFKSDVKELLSKVRGMNSAATILWVNIVSTSNAVYPSYNQALKELSASENFTLVDEKSQNISLGPDDTHPDDIGYKKYSEYLAGAIGKPATSSNTQSSCTGNGGAVADAGGYQNPLRDVSGLTPMRIDQGVDYGGNGPVYAIGKGKVTISTTSSGWPHGNFIAYQLTEGAAKDLYVYVAENCDNIKVTEGQSVDSTTVLCTMHNSYPFIEMGWATEPSKGNLAAAHDVYSEGDMTAYGMNFSQLLKKIGAPEGVKERDTITGSLPGDWPTW